MEKQSISHLYNFRKNNNIEIIYFYIKNTIEQENIIIN